MSDPTADRKLPGVGAWVFSLFAVIFAFGAIVVAAQAWSRSNDAKDAVHQLAEGELLSPKISVQLQEYTMIVRPTTVKAGKVELTIKNAGTMTHEMVLVRTADVDALPRVKAATADRAVGDVDEEAIPESDKPGEAEVKHGQTVTKTLNLTAGTYVMFCNIDTKLPDGTTLNHFQRGMHAQITAA
jgi:uncharacterized cupredoxin-like copper-binding protein